MRLSLVFLIVFSSLRNVLTFFESVIISKETEGKRFIENYGVDGENLYLEGEEYLYEKRNGRYHTKDLLRLFCKDCQENKCKGDNWNKCEYRIYLLDSINKELVRENKELKKTIEKYKMEGVERQQ